MKLSDTPVAILAGGLANRMRPLTETIPKVLLPVAGQPFLAHQLALLHSQGIRRAVLCVGYLGELVQRSFGDGRDHKIHLQYSFDGPSLLGTGGALKAAIPLLGERFFVLYGDSYLPIDWQPVAESFERSRKLGQMTVFRNQGLFDTSNVLFRNGEILAHDKESGAPEMEHIDYGLSTFHSEAFAEYPADAPFDLSALMKRLITGKQLAGYETTQRFYEIGSATGLNELDDLLSNKSRPAL